MGKDKRFVDADTYASKNVPYHIVSYDMFKKDPQKYIDASQADTVIYDEIHRAKNEGTNITKVIREARGHHRNFIGLTGSIVSNSPADVVPLVDAMTNGKHKLGSKAVFESRFMKVEEGGKKSIKHKQVIKSLTAPYIDHVETSDLNIAPPPKKVVETIKVKMSPHQEDLYRYTIDQLDPVTKAKVRYGIGKKLNNRELQAIFSKLMTTRKLSNYTQAANPNISHEQALIESPKMRRVIEEVEKHLKKTPDGKVIVGTQFIGAGIMPLKHHLTQRGYDPAIFIGKGNAGITESTRQKAIEDFKAGRKNILLISGAGGEGLDLPNTTKIIMLDGHYNPEVVQQMEARGIRAGGQSHRDPKDRKVEVTRMITHPSYRKIDVGLNIMDAISPNTYVRRVLEGEQIFQNPFKRPSGVDEIMTEIAKRKADANSELKNLYKKGSFSKADRGKLIDLKNIMSRYMKEFGDKLEAEEIDAEGWVNRRKEQRYIDELRRTATNLATKQPGVTVRPLSQTKYKKDSFDPNTNKLLPKANLKESMRVGAGASVVGAYMGLYNGLRTELPLWIPTAVGAGTMAALSAGMDYHFDRKSIYSTMPAVKAKRLRNLSDEQLRNVLRGEVIKNEEVKVTQHYL